MNRLIAFFARQGIFADLLTVTVILLGIMCTLLINREVFPNVSFDTVTVTTILPGAAPTQVEKLITNPIEQELKEVDGVKKITSVSAESRSFVMIQLDPDQTTDQKGKSDVKDVIDRMNNLPDDAEEPIIELAESKNQPIIEVSLAGDLSEAELRKNAKHLEKLIEEIRGVAKVVPRGMRDEEIRVEARPKDLARYGVSLEDLITAIKGTNISIPAGVIDTEHDDLSQKEKIIQTSTEFTTKEDVENSVIRANDLGYPVKVKDVAHVFWDFKREIVLNRTDGYRSLNLTVLKKENSDAITVVDEVKALLQKEQPNIDSRISVSFINDVSYYVRRRLNILKNNLYIGLVLVLIVLSLLLKFRVAILVSLAIPFAFLGTLIVFYYSGSSLNLITMMGLIIVVGMLVDDSIVVTDNCVRHLQKNPDADPIESSIKGAQEIAGPVLASVATTIVAFLPMVFMTGIFGKFASNLPLGVIYGLIISLIECFLILPYHIGRWMAKPKEGQKVRKPGPLARLLEKTEEIWENSFVPKYVAALTLMLKRKYLVVFSAIGGLILCLVLVFTSMKLILFPPEGVEIFFIRTETPVGTSLHQHEKLLAPIEEAIAKLPKEELENFTTTIGVIQQDPNDPNTKRGSEFAQIAVYLTPEPKRDRYAKEIIEKLRDEVGKPAGFTAVTFERINPGPPVGKAVDIGVRGEHYEDILPAAKEVQERLSQVPGVTDLNNSYVLGKEEIVVKLDLAETSAAGLSTAMVGAAVRSAFEGTVASTITTLEDEIDIRVSLDRNSRQDINTLNSLIIRNPLGNLIPLSRISKLQHEQNVSSHQHQSNKRQVSVYSGLDTDKNDARSVAKLVGQWIPELEKKYKNVKFYIGGENEDTNESLASLMRSFAMAFFGIFLILVLIFKNLLQPLLILGITLPLGLISIIIAFFLHGMPLTFMGFLGMIALAGVIVNNSIVFIDFVNREREEGADKLESIINAGRLRIRAIFLTTITTVFGILPTAYGLGGLDKFVVPIAMALGWGLFFGSFLTTLVFPAALSITDDMQDWIARRKQKKTEKVLLSH